MADLDASHKCLNIGICGKMFSGKTTLANHIVNNYNYKKVAFGDKVKQFATEICGMDPNAKDRELLQKIGNGARDIISKNVWIDALDETIKLTKSNNEYPCNFVCDDIRYENEAEALMKRGWLVIKVKTTPEIQKERMKRIFPLTWEDHWNRIDHVSEINIDDIVCDESYFGYESDIFDWIDNIMCQCTCRRCIKHTFGHFDRSAWVGGVSTAQRLADAEARLKQLEDDLDLIEKKMLLVQVDQLRMKVFGKEAGSDGGVNGQI